MENKYSSHLLNKLQTYKINLKDKNQQPANTSYKSKNNIELGRI